MAIRFNSKVSKHFFVDTFKHTNSLHTTTSSYIYSEIYLHLAKGRHTKINYILSGPLTLFRKENVSFCSGKIKNVRNVLKRKNIQRQFQIFLRVLTLIKNYCALFLEILWYFSFATRYFPTRYCKIIRFRSFSFQKHILLYVKKINCIFVHMSVKA